VRLCQVDLSENPISEVDLRKVNAKAKDRESGSGALSFSMRSHISSLTRRVINWSFRWASILSVETATAELRVG
jgi:hypothetical protein